MSCLAVDDKVAFIGCGNIAHVHMRFLKKLGHSVAAVCDSSQLRTDLFSEKYGIPKKFTDVDVLLKNENPKIVHILTPPHTHYSLIMKSLMGGCNVIVEKPLCQSLEEYQDIVKLAAEMKLLISVDHTRVYNPMIAQARKRVLAGEIGKIIRMEYAYDDPSLIKADSATGGHRWAKGVPVWFEKIRGGVATDLLPHPLSVFLSFQQGLQVQHVQAHTVPGEIIDELTVLLKSESCNAIINISLNQKPLKNHFSIYGDKGSIRIDLRNMYSVYQPERRLPGILSRVIIALSESWQIFKNFSTNVFKLVSGKAHTYDGLDTILFNFYHAVTSGERSELPLINADKVTALVDEIIQVSLSENIAEAAPDGCLQQRPDGTSRPADYLVLGGTGFIGRSILDNLVTSGKSAKVLCRSARNIDCLPQTVAIAFGDMRDLSAVSASFTGIKTVIHCAAAMSGDWAEFYESTVLGTRNVLKALEGSSVKRLIYISSLGVLDYNMLKGGGRVEESSPIEAKPSDRGFYTRAKVEAEQLVLDFSATNPEINVVILRPGLVYGADSNNNLQNCGVLLDKFLLVFGLGKRSLGLSYVENLAQAVVLAGEANLSSGTIVQIVEPNQPTVRTIILEHNLLSDQKVTPIFIPIAIWKLAFFAVDTLLFFKSKKMGTFRYRFASNSKILDYQSDFARTKLGWLPQYDIKESFAKSYRAKP